MLVLVITLLASGYNQKCIQGHTETIYHPKQLVLLPIGKGFMYVPKAAYYENKFICDQYENNK